MKKFSVAALFDNKRFLKVFSIAMAVILWLLVVKYVSPITEVSVHDVPVTISDEQLAANGLRVVEGADTTVKVSIRGERYLVGTVRPVDLDIVADLTGISQPGTFDVTLAGGRKSGYNDGDKFGKGFQLIDQNAISPSTVRIRVDRLKKKTFTITADTEGLRVPQDDYIDNGTYVSPKEVTISGPEADIDRIDKCVVSATFDEPLTANKTLKREIVLYDAEGNVIEKELLSMDTETANITVQVLKRKSLPIVFQYTSIPKGFPINELDYTLSKGAINVAGPADLVDSYSELDIGYIPVKEITKEKEFVFPVDLQSGFINLDDEKSILVSFDTEDMLEASFTIPGENIIPVKTPVNYSVTVNTPSISGVRVIGDPEVMETLSGSDLIAEIDLSERELTPGPYNLPVKISAPGKGLVWATGEYTAVVTVKEK